MRKKTPKHVLIGAHVRRLIRKNRLEVGDVVPTEKKLADDFECSRGTVRRALDTLVNEGLIRRKQGAGHFVARRFDARREPLLGLILPNILNAEILRLAQLFTLGASRKGYRILLGVIEEQPAVEREFINDLHRLKVSGVIKFPTTQPEKETILRAQLRALGLPYVILNDFWTDSRHDHHVGFDEATALEDVVNHLVELGHTRIGWVDGSDGPRERALAILREALAKYALTLPDSRVLLCPPYETPPVEKLWREPDAAPTALVTPYDGIAVRLIETLARIGLKVPEDVSIANLNGPAFYMTSGLELTTTIPPNKEIAAKALEILTENAHDQAVCQYLFRPRFRAGRTAVPPRDVHVAPAPAGETHSEGA